MSRRSSTPAFGSSWKENPTFDSGTRKCTGAKLGRVDEENQKNEHDRALDNNTNQLACSSEGKAVRHSNDFAEQKEQQRRTLREKISGMRLLGRRVHEDALQVPEQSDAKAAISRRKSMLLIFK